MQILLQRSFLKIFKLPEATWEYIQVQGEEKEREEQFLLRALEDKNFNVVEKRELRNIHEEKRQHRQSCSLCIIPEWE